MWDDGDAIHARLVQQQAQAEDEQRLVAVLEEAFEVQTYQPFHGWAYDRFCDRSGNTFPALSEAAADVAGDAKLNALREEDVENMEIGVLPSSEWMWSHPWLPDLEYTHCDEDGWTYGSTIARINRRLAEGTSKIKREYYHFVRRRRWIRMRVKKPTVPQDQSEAVVTIANGSARQEEDNASSGDLGLTDTSTASAKNRYYRENNHGVLAHIRMSTPSSLALSQFTRVRFSDEDVLREGWLGQRGTFSRSWKLRYFILLRDVSALVCLRDRASLVAVGVIPIGQNTSTSPETSPNPNQFQFLVISGQHRIRLNAVDGASRERWLLALNELIVRRRKSFIDAEDSDSVHNGVSNGRAGSSRALLRFGRSSTVSEDGHSGWTAPGLSKMPSGSLSDPPAQPRKKKRAWRPYRLIASTMHSKAEMEKETRAKYLVDFEEEFTDLLRVATEFLEANIDILEYNLRVAEHVLTAAVARVPQDDLSKLREEVGISVAHMAARLETLVGTGHANVLQCNILRKALYVEVKRITDVTLSFAPPVGQATVKKVAPESPSKRRIPTDWFMGPISTEKPDKSEKTGLVEVRSVVARPYEISSAESTSSTNLTSTRRARLSLDSGVSSFLNGAPTVSLTTTFGGTSEPVSIQAFRPLPSSISEGHMELPDGVNGYVFVVHEHDLGSLISFTLCSEAYVKALHTCFDDTLDLARELRAEELSLGTKMAAKRHTESISNSTEIMYLNKLGNIVDAQHTEVKFAFESGSTKHEFRCVSFFAAEFHALRALSGHGNVDFLCSLARSKRWEASGGKSGAFFSLSHDNRYVLKGIPVNEFNMFLHMAPQYFKFMSRLVKTDTPTVITKILGLFKVTYQRRLHKHSTYVVVMENITYGFPPGQTYDIKGITRRRYSGPGNGDSPCGDEPRMIHDLPVLLDGNLMDRIPIPVRKADLDIVETAFQNDTGFLCRAGVIDYSLIMVFDEEKRQVVVGLIDYLHQFDLLKKMESTSKASLTFRNPTIISPPSYRTRFVNAMHRYLVGIELELELRIRQKASDSKGKPISKPVEVGTDASGVQGVTTTNGCHPEWNGGVPLMVKVPQLKAKRAFSDSGPHIEREGSFGHRADQAHSDGDSCASESSDESNFRESGTFVRALMPEDECNR